MPESKRAYINLPSFEETAAFVDEELREMEGRIVLEEAASDPPRSHLAMCGTGQKGAPLMLRSAVHIANWASGC